MQQTFSLQIFAIVGTEHYNFLYHVAIHSKIENLIFKIWVCITQLKSTL